MGISSPDLLEEAIRSAKELLDRLEREQSGLCNRIAEVKEHLSKLTAAKQQPAQSVNGDTSTRRRKGENRKAIHALYETRPHAALTKQQIAEQTGLPFSSVQAVLEREDSGFVMEGGGLWKRKKTAGQ